jgi:hypothetical protein
MVKMAKIPHFINQSQSETRGHASDSQQRSNLDQRIVRSKTLIFMYAQALVLAHVEHRREMVVIAVVRLYSGESCLGF